LVIWRINAIAAGATAATPAYAAPADVSNAPGEDDDLPF